MTKLDACRHLPVLAFTYLMLPNLLPSVQGVEANNEELGAGQSQNLDWVSYKRHFNKSYSDPEEDTRRRENFFTSKRLIDGWNNNKTALHSIELGLNHMSDWHDIEFKKMGIGAQRNPVAIENPYFDDVLKWQHMNSKGIEFIRQVKEEASKRRIPEMLDWHLMHPNRVSHVKDQGQCGSCWAFAATGLLEGQQATAAALKHNAQINCTVKNCTHEAPKLVPLSEQQLMDCNSFQGSCLGGGMSAMVLEDILGWSGVQTAQSYPYVANRNKECRAEEKSAVMPIKSWIMLNETNADIIKIMVAVYGPIAVPLVHPTHLAYYKSGVITGEQCVRNTEQNHEALIVGYGTSKEHGPYWIVKNSYGADWGEGGYFRIQSGKNMCRIEEEQMVVLV